MSEQLKPLIDQLVKMIQQGQDVIGGQLPEVAKQLLEYQRWSCHLWMMVFIVSAIVMGVLVMLAFASGEFGIFNIIFIPVFLVIVWGVFYEYDQLNEIRIAPKVFLIQTLMSLGKNQ